MLRRLGPSALLAAGLLAATHAAADAPGEKVFAQRCAVCHAVDPAPGKMGPPLRGVVGRKAGAASGYAYSEALRKSGLTWTGPQLDRFLMAPGRTVRGTKMTAALADAGQRAAVIAYMQTLDRR